MYQHFDFEKLASKVLFLKQLVEQLQLETIEDVLIWAAAFEMNAYDLRIKAVELAKEKEKESTEL